MKKRRTFRFRNGYLLKDSDGNVIKCSDYADLLQSAVKAVLTDKELTFRECEILVDQLNAEEASVFEQAIRNTPALKGFYPEETATYICKLDGKPVRSEEINIGRDR